MMSDRMEEALNKQINAEMEAFYSYLSMAAYFESENLLGFSTWMRNQADEELTHALKIYDFVHERDGRVVLHSLNAPRAEWAGPADAFRSALDHERQISEKIDKLVDLAIEESDHASHTFLQWFVSEQVEEVATVNAIVQKLKLIEGAPGGLFLVDQELGQRPAEDDN